MKFEIRTKLELIGNDLWSTVFFVENSTAEKLIEGKDRRITCELEGSPPFHCALLPSGDGRWFVLVNKKRMKSLDLNHSTFVKAVLRKDRSKYGMTMPMELEEVLQQDDLGYQHFENLTPGKQRNIIHYVAQVKSSDIKIRRAFVIVEHLKKNKGKLLFKDLAEEIKVANREARGLN